MSSFSVQVRRLTISEHPNADQLEIGQVDGYQFIVGKGQFKNGDLGVYIPEQAIVPDELISQMGLEGRLAGPQSNRVKAIRLRGVVSQGLFYRPAGDKLPGHWDEGVDVAEELGIKKYEPELPAGLQGKARAFTPRPARDLQNGQAKADSGTIFQSYDIENVKHYPDLLIEGEQVVMTEKLHGTAVICGILNGERVVSSKGIAARGLVLEEDENNTYWKIVHQYGLFEKLQGLLNLANDPGGQIMLFGECLGVQDLTYGLEAGQLSFRAFDLLVPSGFVSYNLFFDICRAASIPTVPVLYHGPFSQAKLDEHTSGKSSLADHIREGVVVRPTIETYHPHIGRLVFKSVSPAYLTRKGNTTEFN